MTIRTTIVDGTKNTFTLPAYTGTPTVRVNGTIVTWTLISPNTISLTATPTAGQVVSVDYTEIPVKRSGSDIPVVVSVSSGSVTFRE